MARGRGGGRAAQPSLMTKFNWERDSAPASGPYGYYFRWSDSLVAYDLSSYSSEYSDHQVNEQMIVTFFKDVHAIKLSDPKKTNFLSWCNCISMLGGIVAAGLFFLFGYNQNTPVKYEVTNYDDYKVVTELPDTSYLIYTPMVAMAHFLLGVIGWLFINGFRIQKMRLGRLTKRLQQIKEVFDRHQATTFSGLRISLQTGGYGGYIGLKFDWKQPAVTANMGGLGLFGMGVGYNAPEMAFNAPPPGF